MKRLLQAFLIAAAIGIAAFIGARIAFGAEGILKGESGYTKPAVAGTDYSDPTTVTAQINTRLATLLSGTTLQYLRADGTIATLPTSLPPSGSAGGSLAGTYPNPTLSTTGVSAGTYSGVTVTTEGRVTDGTTRSFSSASRSLNSAFQISASRDVLTSYSVDILSTATVATGQQGTVYLEYADNSGFSINVVEVARFVNGSTVTIIAAITLTQNVTATLTGIIPAGKYVRLRTENNVGTPTFNYRSGQEVQL